MTDELERCGFTWADGWGAHVCNGFAGHAGAHGCRCDAVLRAGQYKLDDEGVAHVDDLERLAAVVELDEHGEPRVVDAVRLTDDDLADARAELEVDE